ncbi:hypothetical protein SAMD00019534_010630 [Acytostelium subglobosum LB1]|uniref:hypothetical protein n=1 Tax=Acytostelium subglobosum LB1 TaxID=1410327 RepID=UPI000644C84E|nr:hypothetical protein SAMD00019534_010630 [Acytostelium subglobosum LB1]GAM17888.1 hypothetical protein SAMD00019534_010630 [Acytostelium subglobosum LB1]|eukprot:XP_012758484.1 hypothetical protein SAMD00019534_010630 [Acytostelium subglobosum LB1]
MSNYNYILLTLLLTITFTISTINGQTCQSCVKLNEVCNKTTSICSKGSGCALTDDGTYRCLTIPGNGEDCRLIKHCTNFYTCDEKTNRCVSEKYLGFGEECTNNTQCSRGLTCSNVGCTSVTYPNCSTSFSCKYNEICMNGACAVPPPDGSDCKNGDECEPMSNCLNGKCTPYLSVQSGGDCDMSIDCDVPQGLICIDKKCQSKNILTNTKCNDSSTCWKMTDNALCKCDGKSSPSIGSCALTIDVNKVTKSMFTNFNSCLMNNKCPKVDQPIPGTCYNKCGVPMAEMDLCGNGGSGLLIHPNTILTCLVLMAAAWYLM